MNKHIKELFKRGLLSFKREYVVFDLLKDISTPKLKEEKKFNVINLKKGKKKFTIKILKDNVITKGTGFDKILEELKTDCFKEYAVSVRSKKDLLLKFSTGRFVKFVLVPVFLEAYNYFNLNLKRFAELLSNSRAEQEFLFFKVKKELKVSLKGKNLTVGLNNSAISISLKKSKVDTDLLMKNFEVGKYQNFNRDAFFAGLPYLLKTLNGEDFDYSFNGKLSDLNQLCKTMLEVLYNYLMIELV